MAKIWTKGRGKLGPFQPLLGRWQANADSTMGPVHCIRDLESVLNGKFLRLHAHWEMGIGDSKTTYDEIAMIGPGEDGQVCFWSFTSDGKRSQGKIADVTDLHPEAVGFEADMPQGLARMAYWPEENGGYHWVVEARTKKGWNRMVDHLYQAVQVD